MFKMIYNIARAELAMLFYSPVAWLVLVAFALQAGIAYSGNMTDLCRYVNMGYGVEAVTYSIFSWGGVIPTMTNFLYFYVPLLTMSLVSKELSSGSIKLLYSSPITNTHIIVGKFLSMLIYGLFMVAIMLLFAVCTSFVTDNFDWTLVLAGLLGFYLVLCAYSSIGIFMSSLTSYQIVAIMGTFVILMVLTAVGTWGQEYEIVRDITYWLCITGRSNQFMLGLICSEDVLYFIIVCCLFLALTIIRLNAVRQKIPFRVTFAKNICVLLLICVLGYFTSLPYTKLYYDASATKMNTLSESSQDIIKKVDGDLSITTYINLFEPNAYLYAGADFIKPDIDRFEQYQRFKPDMDINYVYYYDTIRNDDLNNRYRGMSMRDRMRKICEEYKLDSTKFISPSEIRNLIDLSGEGNKFVRQIVRENGQKAWLRVYDDMERFPSEREISAALKRMIMKLPKVGFVEGEGERTIYGEKARDYRMFAGDKHFRYALENQGCDVTSLTLDNPIPDDVNIIVLADMADALTETKEANLQQYIDRGGNMFILGEAKHKDVMNPIFAKFGFEMGDGILVKPDKTFMPDVILSYATKEAGAISRDFLAMNFYKSAVSMPGVCALKQIANKGFDIIETFVTDTTGCVWNELQTTDFLEDTVRYNPESGEMKDVYTTVVALQRKVGEHSQKIVLSGDADCISNGEFGRRSRVQLSNFSLITGFISWFSDYEVPINVQPLPFLDNKLYIGKNGGEVFKWSFSVVLPFLLALVGIFLWIRRKGR